MPMVRAVVKRATANGHTFQAYVTGIVTAPAFRMKSADAAPATTNVAGGAHGRE